MNNLWTAAKRLEQYTDSLRELHQLEDLEVRRAPCPLPRVLREMAEDLLMLARPEGPALEFRWDVAPCEGYLDSPVLFRILENLVSNAFRFARRAVSLSFSLEGGCLTCCVRDDGSGFPEKVLAAGERYLFSADAAAGHIGMGLVISRILCRKHGGALTLRDLPGGGAEARAHISVLEEGNRVVSEVVPPLTEF